MGLTHFFCFLLGLDLGGEVFSRCGFFCVAGDEELDVAGEAPMLLFAAFQGGAEKFCRERNGPFGGCFYWCFFHTNGAKV